MNSPDWEVEEDEPLPAVLLPETPDWEVSEDEHVDLDEYESRYD